MRDLLEVRRKQRDVLIKDIITHAQNVQICSENGFHDLWLRLNELADASRYAARIAAIVEDLESVKKYGWGDDSGS